jgi:hypothetical protein
MPPDPVTDWLPPVPASPPPPPVVVPAGWLRLCVRVTLALWMATLCVWAWLLVLAARALWGAG